MSLFDMFKSTDEQKEKAKSKRAKKNVDLARALEQEGPDPILGKPGRSFIRPEKVVESEIREPTESELARRKGRSLTESLKDDKMGILPPQDPRIKDEIVNTGIPVQQKTKEIPSTSKPVPESKDTTNSSKPSSTPDEALKFYEQELKAGMGDLSKLKDPPITSSELRKQMADNLKEARKSDVDMIKWAEIAEKFIGAMAKYGAAREGLRRGLDMSRVEMEKTDWNSKINQAMDEYKTDMNALFSGFDREDKEKSRVDAIREKIASRNFNLREGVAKLKEARAADARRAQQLREKLLADAKEGNAKRAWEREKLGIVEGGKDRRVSMKNAEAVAKAQEFSSKFTDDPATATELTNAALLGKDNLAAALNRAGVSDKVKSEALKEYMTNPWFSQPKVDVGDLREAILEEKQPVQEAQLYNSREDIEKQLGRPLNAREVEWYRSQGYDI